LLLGIKRFVPRVPAPLATVCAGIAAMALLELQAYGVSTVGAIPRGLPALQSDIGGMLSTRVRSGKFGVMIDDRFAVGARGKGVTLATLHDAVAAVDRASVAALAKAR